MAEEEKQSKKKIILIGIIVLLVLVGAVAYYYLIIRGEKDAGPLFPAFANLFGDRTEDIDFGDSQPPRRLDDLLLNDSTTGTAAPRLRQLSTESVAGARFNNINNSVEYVARRNAHIYEISLESFATKKIANRTIPGIYEALWDVDGVFIVLRHLDPNDLDSIQSFFAQIDNASSTQNNPEGVGVLVGDYLAPNILQLIASDNNEFFYLLKDEFGVAQGNLLNTQTFAQKNIFEFQISEWLVQDLDSDTIALTTKAANTVEGYLFYLNKATDKFTQKLGGIKGLTTLASPDGSKVLYSKDRGKGFTLHVYDFTTHESLEISKSTMPEKCVWGNSSTYVYCGVPEIIPGATYPDARYQGLVEFSDELWKIETSSGETELLAILKEDAREELDIMNMFINKEETHLFFTNLGNGTLWSYRLFDPEPEEEEEDFE